jgi:hypothetical protein
MHCVPGVDSTSNRNESARKSDNLTAICEQIV